MTLRKWGFLFWTTLLIGAIASVLTGFIIMLMDPGARDATESAKDLVVFMIFNAGIGLMYSAFAQMGFFAYLTVNFIARSVIKRQLYWHTLQWIFVAIVFFDVIYLRYTRFEATPHGILDYFVLPVILIVVAILVALWKSKLTNKGAFTPTVFFIFAVTIIESVPALRENMANTTLLAVIPILACNVWQIMKLHDLVRPAADETVVKA